MKEKLLKEAAIDKANALLNKGLQIREMTDNEVKVFNTILSKALKQRTELVGGSDGEPISIRVVSFGAGDLLGK